MTFSDEDLKRLKELDAAASIHDKYGNEEIRKAIPALLARLEAAEMCCQFMWISEHPIDDSATDAYKAWRKAAGK